MAITQSTALMSFEDILSGLAAYTLSYADAHAAVVALYRNLGVADAGVAAANWLTQQGYETAGEAVPLPSDGTVPAPEPVSGGGMLTDEERAAYLAQLEATAAGRATAFGGYLQRTLPSGIPQSARGFAESRFQPLQARWLMRQGFGIPDESFAQFVGNQPGRLSPEDWRARISQTAGLYQQPGEAEGAYATRQGGWGEPTRGLYEGIGAQPSMGYNLALQSALPNVPIPFRSAYEDYAQRQWESFQSQTPDAPFLPWFAQRGYKF